MTFSQWAALSLVLWTPAADASIRILNRRIESGQTLAHALRAAGMNGGQVDAVVGALSGVFDFRKSRVGDQLRLVVSEGELEVMDYRQGPTDEWQVRREGGRLWGERRIIEVEKREALVELAVNSSLYEAALASGEDPLIAIALSDVFAWDIDFYQDVRKGDRVRAVVQKYLSKGRLVRYGDVLAAEYQGNAVGRRRIFRYALPNGGHSYFQQDGKSARKTFLKSPLKYAHITSRFGSRFHPILQYLKAHNGVDYGTPVGTPIWAVADGTVVKAAYNDVAGKHLCIRHMNGFETCYLHLSGFASSVRQGARVSQKQVVAYSGNTGRSTGPHLHFAMKRGGRFVNPLNQNFPRADPLPKNLADDFQAHIAPMVAQLEAESMAEAAPTARAP